MRALGFEVPEIESESKWKKISCVFHEDRKPSATVSLYGYQCFSCDQSGDAIKMIMLIEKVDFLDALARAKEITGLEGSKPRRKRRSSTALSAFSWD